MAPRQPLPRLAAALALGALAAQAPADLGARDTALRQSGANRLYRYAQKAATMRLPGRAREALDLLLTHYDPAHAAGQKLRADVAARADAGNASQQSLLRADWQTLAGRLAAEHRELGLALQAAGHDAATWHLQRCLALDPRDTAAHRALGHPEFRGFHGSAEEIAFLQRHAAIEAKARELVQNEVEVTAVAQDRLPPELQRSGLPLQGAKGRRWVVWTTDAGAAAAAVQWLCRAEDLLEFLLPSGPERRAARVDARPVAWLALLRDDAQWQQFFAANPDLLRAAKLDRAPAGTAFRCPGDGARGQLFRGPVASDGDLLVAHVAMWGFAQQHNEGLGQGLVHTMTSLLLGTTATWFGAEPRTRASGGAPAARSREAWTDALRAMLRQGQARPVVQLPRERLDGYREATRVQAWSFVGWLIARFPDRWPRAFTRLRTDGNPLPEAIDAVFREEFGLDGAALDAAWREFAGGDSPLARAAAGA